MNSNSFAHTIKGISSLFENGLEEKALYSINVALKKYPNNTILLATKVFALSLLKRPDEALKIINKLFRRKLDKKLKKLLLNEKIIQHLRKEDYLFALKESNNFLKKFPEDHTVLEHKGVALLRLKKYKQALKILKRSELMLPDCISCIHKILICHVYLKNYSVISPICNKLLKKNPEDMTALKCLFTFYFETKRYSYALRYVNKILKKKPESYSFYLKAQVLYYLGKKKSSIKNYELALLKIFKEHNGLKKCKTVDMIYSAYLSTLISLKQYVRASVVLKKAKTSECEKDQFLKFEKALEKRGKYEARTS